MAAVREADGLRLRLPELLVLRGKELPTGMGMGTGGEESWVWGCEARGLCAYAWNWEAAEARVVGGEVEGGGGAGWGPYSMRCCCWAGMEGWGWGCGDFAAEEGDVGGGGEAVVLRFAAAVLDGLDVVTPRGRKECVRKAARKFVKNGRFVVGIVSFVFDVEVGFWEVGRAW